jgi:hypothetical protein
MQPWRDPCAGLRARQRGAVTFRNADAQARANDLDARAPAAKLTSVALFDPVSGSMRDATSTTKSTADVPGKPTLFVTKKRGAPPGLAGISTGGQAP